VVEYNPQTAEPSGPTHPSILENLPRNKDIGNILIFTQQGQMQENFNGFGVRRHDNELTDAAVERLGGLVGTLFDLLVVRRLLDQILQGDGEFGVRQGKGFLGHDG
jgi:hypothetical protein